MSLQSIKIYNVYRTSIHRKEEAVNRPKMEFVPKTLADLHIEGIHDLNHGRRFGSTPSLSRAQPCRSNSFDLLPPTNDPLKAWENLPPPYHNHFKPHPAPRITNGRTGDFIYIYFAVQLRFTAFCLWITCGLVFGGGIFVVGFTVNNWSIGNYSGS